MPDEVVQQTPSKKVRKHFSKKKKLIIFLIIFVVLAGAGFGAYLIFNNATKISIDDQAVLLAAKGKTGEATDLIDAQLSDNNNEPTRMSLLNLKATILFNANKYDEALAIVKQLYSLKKSESFAAFLAQIYAANGDKTNAIKYYQEAITLIGDTSESGSNVSDYYEYQINQLGEKD